MNRSPITVQNIKDSVCEYMNAYGFLAERIYECVWFSCWANIWMRMVFLLSEYMNAYGFLAERIYVCVGFLAEWVYKWGVFQTQNAPSNLVFTNSYSVFMASNIMLPDIDAFTITPPKGSSWSWLYGSRIYNCLCISQQKLWVRIPLMARCTRCNIMR
jgi:hypothetical protein